MTRPPRHPWGMGYRSKDARRLGVRPGSSGLPYTIEPPGYVRPSPPSAPRMQSGVPNAIVWVAMGVALLILLIFALN